MTNSINLTAANHDLLAKAIESLGYTVERRAGILEFYDTKRRQTVTIQAGQISVQRGKEAIIDEVKRAYSQQVLKTAAQRFGWQVQQLAGSQKTRQFAVSRRF